VSKDISPPRRGFSFKDFSLSQPAQPLPGDRLDTELDRLGNQFKQLEEFLLTSFERDGTLKGRIVETRNIRPDAFSPFSQQFDRAIQSALQIIEAREKSTQNLTIEAREARNEANDARLLANTAAADTRDLNRQAQDAAHTAQQARARAEAALGPLAATRAETETAAASARIAEDMAYRWAEKTDGPVFVPNGGDPVNDGFFSAKYHALRASTAASAIAGQWQDIQQWYFEISTIYYPETKALHEDFFSTYYGAFDFPPVEDRFGNPPTAGDLYFNNSAASMFVWNGTTSQWEPFSGGGTFTTFIQLTDTPNTYAGQAGKMLVTNPGQTALVFADPFTQSQAAALFLTPAQADALYLKLAGGTLTGALTLPGNPSQPLHAATKGYVDFMDAAILQVANEKLPLSGGTLTGFLTLSASPTALLHAATKGYVDTGLTSLNSSLLADIATKLPLSGGTLTGLLTLSASPTALLHAATKGYVDTAISNLNSSLGASIATKLALAGGTLTGLLTLSGAPTSDLHASTKKYVDDKVAAIPPGPAFASTAEAVAGVATDKMMSPALVQARSGIDGPRTMTGTQVTFDQVPVEANEYDIILNLNYPANAQATFDFAGMTPAGHFWSRSVNNAAWAGGSDDISTLLDTDTSTRGITGSIRMVRDIPGSRWVYAGTFRSAATRVIQITGTVQLQGALAIFPRLNCLAGGGFTGGLSSIRWRI
jgi:hypothetical protein